MEKSDNESDNEIDHYEIRFVLKSDAKKPKGRDLFNKFKEISDYFYPIDPAPVTMKIIEEAYNHWFLPLIKNEENNEVKKE